MSFGINFVYNELNVSYVFRNDDFRFCVKTITFFGLNVNNFCCARLHSEINFAQNHGAVANGSVRTNANESKLILISLDSNPKNGKIGNGRKNRFYVVREPEWTVVVDMDKEFVALEVRTQKGEFSKP